MNNELFFRAEFYKSLFEQHSAPMFIFSRSGKILKVNDAAVKFYGYEKDEIENKFVFDINILPKQKTMGHAVQAFQREKSVFEFRHKLKNGEIKDVEVYSSPISISGEEYLISIIHDVTMQARQKRIFGVIKEISQAAISISSENILFETLTDILVNNGGFKAAFVMLPNRRNNRLVLSAFNTKAPELQELFKGITLDLTSGENSASFPVIKSFLQGKLIISNNSISECLSNYLSENKNIIKEQTCSSSIYIPIIKNSRTVGSICICHDEHGFFDGFADMFEDIGNTVSISLARINDLNEKKSLKNELAESEDLFKTLAEQMQSGLVMYNEKFIYANEAFQKMLGYSWDELKGLGAIDMIADDFKVDMAESIKKGLSDASSRRFVELKAVKKTGEEFWIYAYAGSVKYKGEIVRITNIVNIDEMICMRQRLQQERDLMTTLIENIHAGVVLYDKEKFIYANSSFLDMFCYTKEELSQIDAMEFFNIEENMLYNIYSYSNIFKINKDNKISSRFIYMHVSRDGETRYLDLFRTSVSYNGKETGLAIFSNVTDQILKEQNILKEKDVFKQLSEIDHLTGISNRRYFNLKMDEAFSMAKRYGRPLSLIMLDIDYFKNINDVYGHEIGDIILKKIAAMSKDKLRKSDFIARYGGEEFIIITPETTIETAEKLAERLRVEIMEHDFGIEEPVTASLGVSSITPSDTRQTFIYRTDMALYKAKEKGRNRVEKIFVRNSNSD